MAQPSLIIGDNNWAVKETSLLGYNVIQDKYLPIPIDTVRATTATIVNELGLIEVVPRNLLTYSGDFSDASWVKAGGATITLSTIEPPFPNVQTYNLTNIGDSLKYISKDTETIINASYSFYLKAIDASDIGKTFGFKISNSSPYLSLELTDEWQRIDVFSSPLTGNYFRLLSLGSEATTKVCIAAAQLEQGSLTEYFPTTTRLNIPRIDYSSGSASLLVEPQRTNIVTYSEDFSNASWTKINATVTDNYGISPNGTQNADRIQFTTSNTSSVYRAIGGATTDANTIYVKGMAGEKVLFGYGANVSVGTLFTLNGEWQRLEQISTTGTVFHIGNFSGGNATDVLIWGAQREQGSYPTSYIPTVASTVTRNADVISKTGISSLIGQTEGTMFADLNFKTNTNFESDVRLNDGTSNNTVSIFNSGFNPIVSIRSNNTNQVVFTLSTFTINSAQKIAITYKNNEFKIYQNGVLKLNQLTGNVPLNLNKLSLSDGFRINSVNSIQLYKTALTDAECIALTTL